MNRSGAAFTEETTEAMLTIEPSRRSRMCGRKALMVEAMVTTLTRKLRSSSAAEASSTVPTPTMPTQLTSTWAWANSAASLPTASSLVTSSTAVLTPAAGAQASSTACCRSTATTSAPSRLKASAMARPMPWPAPVTTQVLPVSLVMGEFLFSGGVEAGGAADGEE